jgi:hypothetical protein
MENNSLVNSERNPNKTLSNRHGSTENRRINISKEKRQTFIHKEKTVG